MAYGPHIPLVDNEVWAAIVQAFRKTGDEIEKGLGQETMQRHVREASGKYFSKRRIRRVLIAAWYQGRVRTVSYEEREAKGLFTEYSAYRLVSSKPLDLEPPAPPRRGVVWQFDFSVVYKRKVFRKIILCDSYEEAFRRAQRRGGEVICFTIRRCW